MVTIPRVYEYINKSFSCTGMYICSTITGLNVVDIFNAVNGLLFAYISLKSRTSVTIHEIRHKKHYSISAMGYSP